MAKCNCDALRGLANHWRERAHELTKEHPDLNTAAFALVQCADDLEAAISQPAEPKQPDPQKGRPVKPHRSGSGYPKPNPDELVSALGVIRRQENTNGSIDACPVCGDKAPPTLPGPKEPPRQWYCPPHRHLGRDKEQG
jgi:hypothetical protein